MIELKNVSKTYSNGNQALKNVNLKIEQGEFVFVVGASGAGKSTFLKLVLREEVPTSGEIIVNNYNLVTLKKKEIPYFRRTMGVVFQDFRLIQNMTVYDNVAFAMRVIGAKEKEIRKRVGYVLDLVGLASKAKHTPLELSGGEQQRVALARALVNNADMIIADEPTGNIDPDMSYEIVDLLNHLHKNGTTVVMVTHEHELVRQFNERVVVIENGYVASDEKNNSTLNFANVASNVLKKTNAQFSNADKNGSSLHFYSYGNEDRLDELIMETKKSKALEKEREEREKRALKRKRAEARALEAQQAKPVRNKTAQDKHVAKARQAVRENKNELIENIDEAFDSVTKSETLSVKEQYAIYLEGLSGGDNDA